MEKVKKSIIYNTIIFLLVLFGTIFMISGYQFMSNTSLLDSTGLSAFKFYTVDSNVLAGISSLVMLVYEILFLNNKIDKIPKHVFLLKYISVVGVSLTFLITAFYLAPLFGKNFILLYMNTNLFFHLFVPVLSVVSYIKYEKSNMEYKYAFYTLSSVIIYAIYYISNILSHLDNGKVVKEYDWYNFVVVSTNSIAIVFIIILFITYLIAHIIYKLNKRGNEYE